MRHTTHGVMSSILADPILTSWASSLQGAVLVRGCTGEGGARPQAPTLAPPQQPQTGEPLFLLPAQPGGCTKHSSSTLHRTSPPSPTSSPAPSTRSKPVPLPTATPPRRTRTDFPSVAAPQGSITCHLSVLQDFDTYERLLDRLDERKLWAHKHAPRAVSPPSSPSPDLCPTPACARTDTTWVCACAAADCASGGVGGRDAGKSDVGSCRWGGGGVPGRGGGGGGAQAQVDGGGGAGGGAQEAQLGEGAGADGLGQTYSWKVVSICHFTVTHLSPC